MKACSLDDCNGRVYGHGLCMKHWARMRHTGTTDARIPVNAGQTCKAEGCDKPAFSKGLCATHHHRMRKHGSLDAPKGARGLTLAQRLAFYVILDDGCWEWGGSRLRSGYGNLHHEGRTLLAHRAFYELLVGPIPEGFQIDHLCRNPPCVRPDHLEAVTQAENLRRQFAARGVAA